MKIVVNMTMGAMLAAFSEGMALAEACDLPVGDLLAILDQVRREGALELGWRREWGQSQAGLIAPPLHPLSKPTIQTNAHPITGRL